MDSLPLHFGSSSIYAGVSTRLDSPSRSLKIRGKMLHDRETERERNFSPNFFR